MKTSCSYGSMESLLYELWGGHFRGDGESCAIEGIGIASVALVVRVWLLTKDIDSLFGE